MPRTARPARAHPGRTRPVARPQRPALRRASHPAVGPATAPLAARVFARLADGRFHSGEALAQTLDVSRSAIWKAVGTLRALGTPLNAVPNRGYRMPHGGEALDATAIRERLPRELRAPVADLRVEWALASTNTALLERPNPPCGRTEVLLAECQTAGRGRRGRIWLAPPGGAVCLSLSWTFAEVPSELGALGLVIGVCALRALATLGVAGVMLKWPNDLEVGGKKLGGVLIDLRAESAGPACVVIGIGLNVSLGAAALARIAATGTAATDLVGVVLAAPESVTPVPSAAAAGAAPVPAAVPSRNAVSAALVSACVRGLLEFEREGLKGFLAEWRAADALRGRMVNVQTPDGTARGVARGVDVHGALMVETPEGVKRFISGDVTVRS